MRTRRTFLAGSLAAAAGLTTPLPALGNADKSSDSALRAAMEQQLALTLGDEDLAKQQAGYLLDIGFHWAAPAVPASKIESIVAYGFGNRLPPADVKQALPDPGPINEELADAVWQVYLQGGSRARIFAQWEIARFLKQKHPQVEIVSIEPVIAKDGAVTYLSTDGVAEAVLKHNRSLGVVGVVGHRDHAKRCVLTSRSRGMDAYVAREVILPVNYDPRSGQPWTRRRDLYLVHDMAAQFMMLRAGLVAKEFPAG